jgi:hypothetical protein
LFGRQVALSQDKLESSTLLIKSSAKLENGAIVDLPEIKVPRKLDGFSVFQVTLKNIYFSQIHIMTIHIKLWQQHCNV